MINSAFPSPQKHFTLTWAISRVINRSHFVDTAPALPTSMHFPLLFRPQKMKNITECKNIELGFFYVLGIECIFLHCPSISSVTRIPLLLPYPHLLHLVVKTQFTLYFPHISFWKQSLHSSRSKTRFLQIQYELMLFELHFLSCWQNIFTPFFLPGGTEASCCFYKTRLFKSSQSDRPTIYPETW